MQGIPGTQCHLDDIILTGRDANDHLANLEAVLKRLSELGLRVNKEKCEFFKDSNWGIGAVLSHRMTDGSERPIAFASRSLNKAEQNYAQIDREGLSLIWGVNKFHQYLYGKNFTLITNHQPLVAIFNPGKSVPAIKAARLQRWALFLGAHDYTIEFKGTKLHGNADGLSRLPHEQEDTTASTDPAELFHVTQMENLPVTFSEVRRETGRDPAMVRGL